MPSVNSTIFQQGPLIDVFVEISTPRKTAMQAAGLSVPKAQSCRLLIDTGASATCLDSWVFNTLGIKPISSVSIQTPSTSANNGHTCNQYDVCLVIPHTDLNLSFHAIPVIESSFTHQGIDGLLGRDVLSSCVFIYNGETKTYTLSI